MKTGMFWGWPRFAAVALVVAISLYSGFVAGSPVTQSVASAEAEILPCGDQALDESDPITRTWEDIEDAESTHDIDLPAVTPSGYTQHDEVELAVDPLDDAFTIDVYYSLAASAGTSSFITIHYASPDMADSTLPTLASNEIGWVTMDGGYRILTAHEATQTAISALTTLACGMATYTGSC